jgi:hypothetical protein
MGNAGEAKAAGFHVHSQDGVVGVARSFNTEFLNGPAQETCVGKIERGKPFLNQY